MQLGGRLDCFLNMLEDGSWTSIFSRNDTARTHWLFILLRLEYLHHLNSPGRPNKGKMHISPPAAHNYHAAAFHNNSRLHLSQSFSDALSSVNKQVAALADDSEALNLRDANPELLAFDNLLEQAEIERAKLRTFLDIKTGVRNTRMNAIAIEQNRKATMCRCPLEAVFQRC